MKVFTNKIERSIENMVVTQYGMQAGKNMGKVRKGSSGSVREVMHVKKKWIRAERVDRLWHWHGGRKEIHYKDKSKER